MSASRVVATKSGRMKASVGRRKEHRASRSTNRVLAERNPAVVAVGAWVEDGQDFLEHPTALALLTEELQAEKRRENEESLRRFQDEVRLRVSQRAQIFKKRQQTVTDPPVTSDSCSPQQQRHHHQVWTQQVSAGEKLRSSRAAAHNRVMERSSEEPGGGMRQVRLRLAACRMIGQESASELPGGRWNVSAARHKAESQEEEEEEGGDLLFSSRHECPLVQHKIIGRASWSPDRFHPDPVCKAEVGVASRVLWPLNEQEEERRQRRSDFLKHRRLVMSSEREQVKENRQNRKHLERTERIKAEKEGIRVEEERRMERDRQLAEARQKLEEREVLILERLKLEEEQRNEELQRRKHQEKGKVAERFMEALRAQMKQRLSQMKLDLLPPLCCCASSFWDSHPDACANNCIFHNNPKAYIQALHSVMLSLDQQ